MVHFAQMKTNLSYTNFNESHNFTMDLNIIVGSRDTRDGPDIIKDKVIRCMELGHKTIALSIVIDLESKQAIEVPCPPDKEPFKSLKINVLTRLTVRVGETLQLFKLGKNVNTNTYDLLALEPQNSKILQYISEGSTNFDILTFSLSDRLNYNLYKVGFKLLERKGACFEINYGSAQINQALRRNTICNGQMLTEKTSKNIILSSGVGDIFRLRGPKDAESLGILFLLPSGRIYDAVHNNGTKAINSSKHRKNPCSSAIELVKTDQQCGLG